MIHHEGALSRHGLIDGLATQQQKFSVVIGLQVERLALALEADNVLVADDMLAVNQHCAFQHYQQCGMPFGDFKFDIATGSQAQSPHHPRLVTDSAETLHAAALNGLGVVKLGLLVGAQDIQAGRLIDVLPGWEPQSGTLHAIFPTRRSLLPAVRALLDFLGEHIAEEDFATQDALINVQGASI